MSERADPVEGFVAATRLLLAELARELPELKDRALESAFFYGSRVHGAARAGSDLDVLAIVSGDAPAPDWQIQCLGEGRHAAGGEVLPIEMRVYTIGSFAHEMAHDPVHSRVALDCQAFHDPAGHRRAWLQIARATQDRLAAAELARLRGLGIPGRIRFERRHLAENRAAIREDLAGGRAGAGVSRLVALLKDFYSMTIELESARIVQTQPFEETDFEPMLAELSRARTFQVYRYIQPYKYPYRPWYRGVAEAADLALAQPGSPAAVDAVFAAMDRGFREAVGEPLFAEALPLGYRVRAGG